VRALVIDAYARKQVERVLAHALDPRHWYRPGKDSRIPGNDPHFVVHLNTYRCVFTISKSNQGLAYRQLSISIPSENLPNIFAALTIAELFGFTGWDGKSQDLPLSWMAHVSTAEHCIVLAQPYEKESAMA